MRIVCNNGFYKFFPHNVGQIKRFVEKYGVDLIESEDYFTFGVLAKLPNYSIKGQLYSGILPAITNYAGKKEDVMKENGYSYNIATKGLILKSVIFQKLSYTYSNFFLCENLPQAYSYNSDGIITGFHGFIDLEFMRYKIERFFYD